MDDKIELFIHHISEYTLREMKNFKIECIFDEDSDWYFLKHNDKNLEKKNVFYNYILDLIDTYFFNEDIYNFSLAYDYSFDKKMKEAMFIKNKKNFKDNNISYYNEYFCENYITSLANQGKTKHLNQEDYKIKQLKGSTSNIKQEHYIKLISKFKELHHESNFEEYYKVKNHIISEEK